MEPTERERTGMDRTGTGTGPTGTEPTGLGQLEQERAGRERTGMGLRGSERMEQGLVGKELMEEDPQPRRPTVVMLSLMGKVNLGRSSTPYRPQPQHYRSLTQEPAMPMQRLRWL
jgi:hypothetical protein